MEEKFQYKYLKYKTKYDNLVNSLNNNMTGGGKNCNCGVSYTMRGPGGCSCDGRNMTGGSAVPMATYHESNKNHKSLHTYDNTPGEYFRVQPNAPARPYSPKPAHLVNPPPVPPSIHTTPSSSITPTLPSKPSSSVVNNYYPYPYLYNPPLYYNNDPFSNLYLNDPFITLDRKPSRRKSSKRKSSKRKSSRRKSSKRK
jgi:hypothetical protein